MDELTRESAAAEAEQLTGAHVGENALAVVAEDVAAVEHTEAMRTIMEVGKLVGRVQSAQVLATVADSIQVSQLRQLKEIHKAAGLTWEQTCNIIGMARRTADRMLSFANELGDDFFGHCAQIGLSVRAMDAARQLPEPVRQALAQGEVVDLETVSKEALTDVIKQLAGEHAKEKSTAQEALDKESKAREKAEKKAKEAAEQAEALSAELEAQKEGLPAEDRAALELILAEERKIIPWLVRVKNTTHLEGRDKHFVARLVNHLNLVGELALATGQVLGSLAAGQEPNEELINRGASQANQACAAFDQRDPYAGI